MTTPSPSCALLSFSGAASVERPRLYCFPYAGGTSSVFAPWAKILAPQFSVLGVDLPGHGSRFSDALSEDIQEMAEKAATAIELAEGILPHSTPRYAFYGHSLGAVVAFETARLLNHRCHPGLAHLFVAAARAPSIAPSEPAVSHLEDADFLDAVQQRYGGLPAILFEEPELLAMVLPILRADFRAYEAYRENAGTGLPVPITAFCGKQDPVVTPTAMEAWSEATSEAFQLVSMEGGHFFLNESREPLLAVISRRLQALTIGATSSPQRVVTA